MKIYISSCEPFKSGVKEGRKWTLYNITDPQGIRYSSFEDRLVGMVGQEVELDVKETPSTKINPKTNQPYINKTLSFPKKQAGGDAKTMFMLQQINSKLDTILEILEVADVKDLPQSPEVEDLSKEELPELPF